MTDTVQVVCDNLGQTFEVSAGCTLFELARRTGPSEHPWLAALVDNRIRELGYRIYVPATVRFLDITSFAGIRVYQRTAWFVVQKAVQDLWPDCRLHIRHSMGPSGVYCEIEGMQNFGQPEADALRRQMQAIVEADRPIVRHKMLTSQVREIYAAQKAEDKIALLDTRPRLYSCLYTLDDTAGYFYGSLAPSTGYLQLFDIIVCHNGFYLSLPRRTAPDTLDPYVEQKQLFGIFREYQSWVRMMGVPTVGKLNEAVLAGNGSGYILVAEAFHERKFAETANRILEANRTKGTRTVLISGPSSSGKTTSAKRLAIQLGVLGLYPVLISLDDYFVDREATPKDENGDYDYEALEAIDIALFNDHLQRLMRGEQVDIPRYDFITGHRAWHNHPLQLNDRSILIIEGIHGLNPRLTPGIPDEQKFKIYVSCFTSVTMDNLTRIPTTDNRLLRRLTRDVTQRGASALSTLSRWPSVRRGEEKHIFPFQEYADVMLNSSLLYEIAVLRPYAERLLQEVPDTVPEYDEARRLLSLLDNFSPIAPDTIPPTSILREFIGGSTFTY